MEIVASKQRERKKGDLWPLLEFYLALKRGVVAQWGPSHVVFQNDGRGICKLITGCKKL